ncbi:Saccharopine dehydrogenase-domain-containing protein [Gongronella butleri]|nr:Saccharopine dehydrogenase-domain-containing protein [Gongronella butleri]
MVRKYDLVVYGATGFTGATTSEYIAGLRDKDLRWAVAGRSEAKLAKLKQELIKIDESLENLDVIVADASEPASLDAFLQHTTVVLSTVGPYIKYGTPLVEACIRNKTHYVDITGEYTWIKQLIDKFHVQAQESEVMIVPTCGFDSVPSDLGAFMQVPLVVDYMHKHHKIDTTDVKYSVVDIVGGVSGGTLQTMVEQLSDSSLQPTSHVDKYLLASERGIDKARVPKFYRDTDFPRWQAFFVMSVINEKVVQRSWSLYTQRRQSYGRLFTYHESMSFPWIGAFLVTAMIYCTPVLTLLLKFQFFKRFAKWALPQGGAGPSREQRAKGHFEAHVIAQGETEPYDSPVRVRGIVKGFSDPGYSDTCVMLAEAALSIVKNHDYLPGKQGGILTPASAFGNILIDRLNASGRMSFTAETMTD